MLRMTVILSYEVLHSFTQQVAYIIFVWSNNYINNLKLDKTVKISLSFSIILNLFLCTLVTQNFELTERNSQGSSIMD